MTTRLFLNLRSINDENQTKEWGIEEDKTGETGLLRGSNGREVAV
jgi:hypothetical protein